MAPSEDSILANFLVSPASFPRVISLDDFTALFPKRLQSHPHIRTLYRELHHLRAQDIALVKENIEREVKLGEKQKDELRQASAAGGVSNLNARDHMEIDLDSRLLSQPSVTSPENAHTLDTVIPEMEQAVATLEDEIDFTKKECLSIVDQLNLICGELSDLEYGQFDLFPGQDISKEVIKALNNLEHVCSLQGK